MKSILVLTLLWAEPDYSVEETIATCAALKADSDRLACFDQLAAIVGGPEGVAAAPADSAAPSASEARDEKPAGEERYVIMRADDPKLEAMNRPGFLSGFFTREKYEAKVVATKRNNLGMLFIQLDNGEIWRENRPSLRHEPKAGETVILDPGATGGWHAIFPSVDRRTKMRRFDFEDQD